MAAECWGAAGDCSLMSKGRIRQANRDSPRCSFMARSAPSGSPTRIRSMMSLCDSLAGSGRPGCSKYTGGFPRGSASLESSDSRNSGLCKVRRAANGESAKHNGHGEAAIVGRPVPPRRK